VAYARRTPDHSNLGVRAKCLEKGVRPAYAVRSVRLAYAVADGVRQAYSGRRGAPGVRADVGRARRALGAAHSRCALAFRRVRRTSGLGSSVHRVIARDLELGQLEGLGIIEYYGVGCSGGLPPLVIFPSRRRMLVSYWSIVFKNSIN